MAQAPSADISARYARHIVLKEIGGAGQQALGKARILIIGMGGLGNPIAQYLAAAGIGTLGLVDDDVVELTNLQRQILFRVADIGRRKVEVAAEALAAHNPHCQIIPHPYRLNAANAASLIGDYDIIADASDNFATRLLVNDICAQLKKTLVSGAVSRFDGQIATFKPWLTNSATGAPHPCYRALVPDAPPVDTDCATLGIIGALAGIIGSLQALEIIKEITGAGESLAGRLLIYDGLKGEARTVRLASDTPPTHLSAHKT